MSALTHDPDVIRRASRLTRAEYHIDQGVRSFRAARAELDDAGLDWEISASIRRDIDRLEKRLQEEIERKTGEGF